MIFDEAAKIRYGFRVPSIFADTLQKTSSAKGFSITL